MLTIVIRRNMKNMAATAAASASATEQKNERKNFYK